MQKVKALKIYLLAELSKLANADVARHMLEIIGVEGRWDLTASGLPTDAGEIASFLALSGNIEGFLATRSEDQVDGLARVLSEYRQNGVYRWVSEHTDWTIVCDVDLEKIFLNPAEIWFFGLFHRNGWKLTSIASDESLWKLQPYSQWEVGRRIDYPICLADANSDGTYKIFDGIHRAIQLARNGETTIDLCCPAI